MASPDTRWLVLIDTSGEGKRWKRYEVKAANREAALLQVAAPNWSGEMELLEHGPIAEVHQLQSGPMKFKLRTRWEAVDAAR